MATIDRTEASEPRTAPVGHPRRVDIQGLRGIAVLLVVAFHADLPLPGGYVGVDAFFVISGYVITMMLWSEVKSTGKIDFVNFYARRVRRLLPALAVLLAVVIVASLFFQNPLGAQHDTAYAARAAATFSANVHFAGAGTGYFDAAQTTNPLLHTWSLSVEEQFYFVFPLLLLWAVRIARRRKPHQSPRPVTAAIIFGGFLASFLLSLVMTRSTSSVLHIHNPIQFAFYSAPTRAWEFAAGALVALIAPLVPRVLPGVAIALGVLGAFMLLFSARVFTASTPFPGTAALLPVVGTALMLMAGLYTRGITKALTVKPLVKLGDVSYGWYLWHWPAIVFARIMISGNTAVLTVAAIASLIPTFLSYRYVERPVRFSPRPPRQRALAVAAVCIIVPLAGAFALNRAAHVAAKTPTMRNIAKQSKFHADVPRHCDSNALLAKRPADCTWHTPNSKGSVLLLGDSNAGQFVEPVAAASAHDGFDLTVATSSECPFVDLVLLRADVPYTACRRFVTTTIATIKQMHPRLVVLASWGSGYIENPRYAFRDPLTGRTARDAEAKAVAWQVGYTSVLRQLAGAGIPTALVHTIPLFPTWQLNQCPAVRAFASLESCGISASRSAISEQQALSYGAEHRAVEAVPESTEIDFNNELCSAAECTTNRQAFFVYRDGSHLSVNGALVLTPRFEDLIARHATPA